MSERYCYDCKFLREERVRARKLCAEDPDSHFVFLHCDWQGKLPFWYPRDEGYNITVEDNQGDCPTWEKQV